MSTNDFTRAAGMADWDPAKIQAEIDADLNGAGLFEVNGDDPDRKFITNVRRLAGNARTPGSRVIAFATWALFLLGAGLLYVSFEAQFRYVLKIKHQSTPAMIEALSPDVAMVILSALGIGLALAGKASKAERFLIVGFASLAAFMNYAASNAADWRSVVAYTAPPLVLAVITDRVISVIRRHVLPHDAESAWKPAGAAVVTAGKITAGVLVYVLATLLAPHKMLPGLRRMVLAAAPVPGKDTWTAQVLTEDLQAPAIPDEVLDAAHADNAARDAIEAPQVPCLVPVDFGDGYEALCSSCGTCGHRMAYPTKKAAFLGAYKLHRHYGERTAAAQVAKDLAPHCDLQPGTGRTYILEELARLESAARKSELNGSNA